MAGLHVYAIVPAGHAPPAGLTGIGDGAVAMIAAGPIALWAATLPERPAATVDAARLHNDVIRAAMTPTVTPVPARFGQWFDTEDEARRKLAADEARWLADLARFAGRAEFGIRVSGQVADAAAAQLVHDAPTGTGYMKALARRHAESQRRAQEGERIAGALAAAAGPIVAETRVQATPDGVAIANLVAWTDESPYHTAVRGEAARNPALRFLFTGPWPPYSFVD